MNWTLPIWMVINPTNPSLSIQGNNLSLKRTEMGYPTDKDNLAPNRVDHRSQLRTSPPLKGSQPPHTGFRLCQGEIPRPPPNVSLIVRGSQREERYLVRTRTINNII
ncbi:hypothetical protein AVEN_210726-1 [Araneus ventricosus]|uniref:Uncharacterized protein n=1 Tax=Araneus ventricosus TaxID=182803 RepID=A0A4Y2MLE6_ARAVE|nr:hypothetical protein AVEN_210726-1 [Araneus ventricosus]